jgi:hypothetical protein
LENVEENKDFVKEFERKNFAKKILRKVEEKNVGTKIL